MNYEFEEHPAKKGICPQCNEKNVFRYYEGLGREFGICERKNSCGYHNRPKGNLTITSINNNAKPTPKIIYPEETVCENLIKNQESNFHLVCKNTLGIPSEYFAKWNIGTLNENTTFIYNNIRSKAVNIKYIAYDNKCCRIKERQPFYLSSNILNEKYSLCLFGEHLLSGKTICLVESEKTAFIASYFYPQFDWLAIGSSSGLTEAKSLILQNAKVIFIVDADKAGRQNSSINNLKQIKVDFRLLDLFPDMDSGYDLADAIFDGLRPEIPLPPNGVKQVEGAKISHFEKVENFINAEFQLRNNIVANEVEFRPRGTNVEFKALNDDNIYRFLQHNNMKISQANLSSILRSDFVSPYNPFIEYFNSLSKWDRELEPDFIDLICKYVIAKNPDRFKIQLKKALVRTIACAIDDKYFNKHCLVLVHVMQSSGKTTFIRWLVPPELINFIAENINTDKDSRIAVCQNFIINLDELATMNKGDMNSLKSLFSKDKIKDRPPYGKKNVLFPRRATFFGSTDRTEFLSDDAGSVRWLCFELAEKINWDYKKDISITDVWRQAYTLYKSGFKYDLTSAEIIENENVNKSFKITTPEIELIMKTFEAATKESHDVFFTATEVLYHFQNENVGIKLNHVSIGKALKALGFCQEQIRKDDNDYPVKGYYLKFKK